MWFIFDQGRKMMTSRYENQLGLEAEFKAAAALNQAAPEKLAALSRILDRMGDNVVESRTKFDPGFVPLSMLFRDFVATMLPGISKEAFPQPDPNDHAHRLRLEATRQVMRL